jgi:uncharacterized protein
MKTKILILPFLFVLSALPLFSQSSARHRVVDNAGLLSPGGKDRIEVRLDYISVTYRIDLVIVTETSIGGALPMDYADDFFDYNGYGLGNDRDGCLFLIVSGTRAYWISTSGRAIDILKYKNYAYKKLESDALKSLREDNYYAAFNSFLDNWEKFLILEKKNRSYNFFYQWNVVLVIIGWLISLAIGSIVVLIWKRGMNTALLKTQADAYMIPDSLAFNEKTDKFLYSVVTKTERPKDDPSSSSGGGGIHTSSSGRTHGGGGGRY